MTGATGTMGMVRATTGEHPGSIGSGPAFQLIPGWIPTAPTHLRALSSAVPCARWHARYLTTRWRLGPAAEAADAVELLTSELVTNAVGEVAGEPEAFVSLRLSTRPGSVLIEVWDAHRDEVPVVLDAPPDDEHGRGLFLVRTLSAIWGAYRGGFGKVVWAIVEAQGAALGPGPNR